MTKLLSWAVIIVANVLLCGFVLFCMTFAIINPDRVYELSKHSFLLYLFKKLLFGLIVSVISTFVVLLIYIAFRRFTKTIVYSNRTIFKWQFMLFFIISLIGLGFHFYFLFNE